MSKPVAVLISDVHYNINTLALADAAMRQAIAKASDLKVPLIVAGDLHDTKAMLRAECVDQMLKTFDWAFEKGVSVYIMVGNHDLQNEKGANHALHFLGGTCSIVGHPVQLNGLWLLPYYSSTEELGQVLSNIPEHSTIICHQGVQGAEMGHYVKDDTSIPANAFSDFRTISGHYHRRQDIKCGNPRKGAVGLFSYIGNPYTLTFGEANDPDKGFQVLMDDGLLEFVPTKLRKHIILEILTDMEDGLMYAQSPFCPKPDDLVWVKLKGPTAALDAASKASVAEMIGTSNFRFDKIYTDNVKLADGKAETSTDEELMDSIIDAQNDTAEHKIYLKDLWKSLL